jgi:predicted MPP superfamily phosphohydrolase
MEQLPPTPWLRRGAVALVRAGRHAGAVLAHGGHRAAEAFRRLHRDPWWPRLRVAAFAFLGANVALFLAGHVPAKVGPFETTLTARPSLTGHTVVHLAPLGTIDLDTHDWPLLLDLRVDEISVADAERIADDPAAVNRLGDQAAEEVRGALAGLALRCLAVALAGGVIGALVARANWRSAAAGAGVSLLLVATVGLGSAATFNAEAVAEPRYTGLLARAPAAVGDVEDVIARFGEYRAQLAELVGNVVTLYLAGEQLPVFEPGDTIRVLHVSDVHLNPGAFDLMRRLVDQFAIDAVADTGDLTDFGTEPETVLTSQIGSLGVPYVYVRGNHDSRTTQAAVAAQPNAIVLDGAAATVAGLRFWGIGDPRYTPDKSQQLIGSEQEAALAFAPIVANRLEADEPPDVDVAMVHDERMARDLGGAVPLVLAGHTHKARQGTIAPPEGTEPAPEAGADSPGAGDGSSPPTTSPDGQTLLLVEGSTGGGGLRALQGERPLPLTASVLYFDRDTHRLLAYDAIRVSGLGGTGATIQRHVLVNTTPRSPDGTGG